MSDRMLIFVDDSGDPGFKLGKGSSDVFVIAQEYLNIIRDKLKVWPFR